MPSKIVEVKNLNVIFGQHQVLDDLSFDVNKGEVLAIIGPNGAGKTVLFHALIGLSRPTSGVINWKSNVKIGYVPQRFDIEVDLPLTTREFFYLKGGDVTDKKIKEFLDLVGIDHEALNKGISQLSVGQRQRVLVAWAVMNEPEILLFDEPTADIDIRGQQSIYHLLHKIQDQIGFAVILISHDLSVVYKYADQVLCLNSKRVCMGPPREVLSAEQLLELYGGEQTFYKHLEKSFHEDHHA
ncbi:MAG: hypothetical protein A3J53_00345 [Candidatus Harrisonbacteria bacterium RIFCSPHIGHO2_02_FULL_40_20]|nr:MAG: hypothetical protein A3J53_00345 [Candidatus Harrisonbacteria bacterium RIFCSPHIGHO2_02_FULL_40_20]